MLKSKSLCRGLTHRSPGEPEFHQAVREVAESVIPFILEHEKYRSAKLLERISEPDRTVMFRVTWVDDKGEIQVNRGCGFSSTMPSDPTRVDCGSIPP